MTLKICVTCNLKKSILDFSKHKRTKDKLRGSCKICEAQKVKIWRKNNPKKVKEQKKRFFIKNREKLMKRLHDYQTNNRDKEKIRKKKWRDNNKEYQKIYYEKNKKEIFKKSYERKKNDPIYKLSALFRSKLHKILKNKKDKTFDIIGCTPQQLKEHLESQFKEGMSWENHSLYGWHIDHIIPLSFAKTEEDIYKLCHYMNLQPLWAKDNLIKRDKLVHSI